MSQKELPAKRYMIENDEGLFWDHVYGWCESGEVYSEQDYQNNRDDFLFGPVGEWHWVEIVRGADRAKHP